MARTHSPAICSHIAAADFFLKAKQVALFAARPWEVDLRPLWERAPGRCFFPLVSKNSPMLSFYRISSWSQLVPGLGGILEPIPSSDREASRWLSTDLVLVPGTCFDIKGGRIGSGKGYYDRFLSQCSAAPWGVCVEDQVSHTLLAQASTDVRMVALCTEAGVVPVSGRE